MALPLYDGLVLDNRLHAQGSTTNAAARMRASASFIALCRLALLGCVFSGRAGVSVLPETGSGVWRRFCGPDLMMARAGGLVAVLAIWSRPASRPSAAMIASARNSPRVLLCFWQKGSAAAKPPCCRFELKTE